MKFSPKIPINRIQLYTSIVDTEMSDIYRWGENQNFVNLFAKMQK